SNPSIASQDPIDAALVPPLKRSRDVRHTLTALPALPQLGLLFRREPCPCMPLHSHTSSSAKIRRCCVDSLNSPPKSGPIADRSVGPPCAITGSCTAANIREGLSRGQFRVLVCRVSF